MWQELVNRIAKTAKRDVKQNIEYWDDPNEVLSDQETGDVFIGSIGNLLTFTQQRYDLEEAESIFVSEWLYQYNKEYGQD
jgi:hypothetical protein